MRFIFNIWFLKKVIGETLSIQINRGNLLLKPTGMKCQIASLKLPYKELKKNATVFQNYLLIMPLGLTFVLVKASLVWVD